MKTKNFIYAAFAGIILASCSSNDFAGDQNLLENSGGGGAIAFSSNTPAITRADKTGSAAATDLNKNFVVFGYKTMSDDSKQTVFDNYQANYVESSAHSTTTNSAGWEYVGYKNLPSNMTGYTGVAGNTTSGIDQTIKYWDYSASNYKFYAFSLGTGNTTPDPDTYANSSTMSTSDSYTLEGTQEQLAACYISELTTISDPNGSTPKEVDLRFLSMNSKIQLGFYETIPGYSVKSLKFYESNTDDASDATPVIYASTSTLPKAGTYTITFDSNGKPLLAWSAAASEGTQANISFSSTLTGYVGKDYRETEETVYLGRSSNAATKTEVKNILPYANGADLKLKVDYVLISRDGSGETIEAKGATAVVPAAFTQWKPNYKYTYLFKISENSNPLIGEVTGLYPITLDAVVASEQDGSQETITTVSDPSITTYAKASAVLTDNEYKSGANIYVVVNDGVALTVGTNAKLYTATVEAGAAQGITEETVKNAIEKGTNNTTDKTWTVIDALGKKLVVTDTESNLLEAITQIPAEDSPKGVAITVNGAKFKPAAKYVVVPNATPLTEGVTYYTSDSGEVGAVAGENETSDGSKYRKVSDATGYFVIEYIDGSSKHYKVIHVVPAP